MLSLLSLMLLTAPAEDPAARCANFGDVALLGDVDKYKATLSLVKKNAHPCILYHAAMAKLRLAEKTPGRALLVAAAALFAKIDKSAGPALYDWARIRRLELAVRLRDPRLAPDRDGLSTDLPTPERRFLLDTELLSFDSPVLALAAHLNHPLRGKHRLAQLWDMIALTGRRTPERQAVEREMQEEFPDAGLASKDTGPPTEEALLKRMALWHGRHANAPLISAVQRALRKDDVSPAGRCVMQFFKGAAERKLRHYALAERALNEALASCRPFADATSAQTQGTTPIALIASGSASPPPSAAEAFKRAWFLLGQVQAIARPAAIATQTLSAFVERYKDDPLADDALLQAAAAAKKAGDHGSARTFMERLVREQRAGDQCAEASFRLAWQRYREDDAKAAAAAFSAIPTNGCAQDETQVARAHYWRARALVRAGAQEDEVSAALAAAYAAAPMSYYGMLARLRVKGGMAALANAAKAAARGTLAASANPEGESSDEAAAAEPDDMGPPLAASGPSVNVLEDRVNALASVGLYPEAQQELALAKPGDAPLEEHTTYARLLAMAHDYYRAHRPYRTSLRSALGLQPSTRTRPLWETAYPRPFVAHFHKAEREEKLPKDLLLSLVREESAFQLDAGSWANAYGFTQLLVETAARTARDIPGFDKPVNAELLRKEALVALRLGAHLLGSLQKRYKTPPLMLAAYNAGEEAVDHWIARRGNLPVDEFIEEIPFDETRGYVKRILSTWQVYRALAGDDSLAVALGRAYKPLEVAELK